MFKFSKPYKLTMLLWWNTFSFPPPGGDLTCDKELKTERASSTIFVNPIHSRFMLLKQLGFVIHRIAPAQGSTDMRN